MTDPQVPRMPDLMVAAVDALAAETTSDRARLARIHHANHGRFGDVLRGWRGQGEVVRARMTREIIATRNFPSNTGQALRELASSEYFATLADGPLYAVGEATLFRTIQTSSSSPTGPFLAGVIPAGTTITRQTLTGDFPLAEARYATTADVTCDRDGDTVTDLGGGQWLHTQTVTVPIQASRSGTEPNSPMGVTAQVGQRLFDFSQPEANRFQGGALFAAGGSVGVTDPQVRALAKAMARGQFGATTGAALAGCLTDPRVRRVAAVLDYGTAVLRIYVADASWATSARLRDQIKQKLFDDKWLGFGARVAMGSVYNQPITVSATVALRSAKYEAEKTAITAEVRAKLLDYFDERPDFYAWHLNAVGAVIAAADQRVLTCSNPLVLVGGAPAAAPASKIAQGGVAIPHWALTALSLNFVVPGG
jgi:hypothetical protein